MALSLCADCVLSGSKVVYITLGGSSKFLQTISHRLNIMIQTRLSNENNENKNNNNVVDETSSVSSQQQRPTKHMII